jgi:hypothetical protein
MDSTPSLAVLSQPDAGSTTLIGADEPDAGLLKRAPEGRQYGPAGLGNAPFELRHGFMDACRAKRRLMPEWVEKALVRHADGEVHVMYGSEG